MIAHYAVRIYIPGRDTGVNGDAIVLHTNGTGVDEKACRKDAQRQVRLVMKNLTYKLSDVLQIEDATR